MIETVAIGTMPNRAEPSPPKSDEAPVFSFASAVSAIETQAARSLEAHGATPDKGAAFGETSAQARQEPRAASAATDHIAARATEPAPSGGSEPRALAGTAQQNPAPNAGAQTPSPQIPTSAIVIAPQGAAAPTTAQSTIITTKADAAAMRAADIAKPSVAKEAKTAAPAQKPEAPAQDFAKLLARRLDTGATQFELRLDPPSLGRVEAQLRLTDKNENILALKFEHQAALDLFSNDEAALRNALSSSGFEFDNEDVVFELADDDAGADFNAASTPTYEPFYAAPWSSGVVDISI